MATIAENLKTIKDSTTAIKQAIIDKGGTIEGNLTTYASAIANLPSGGGDVNPTAEKNDVTFYDYDGTILYSYTAEEFLALTEMPPLPTQKGLICQEWNWAYEDAREYVTEYGVLNVGATYITDDGKTRLYIRIAAKGRMDVPLYFQQTVANGVTIDWGDGTPTQTLNGTGKVNATHRYASIGDYCITLDVAEGCTLTLGNGNNINVIGGSSSVYRRMLYKAEIGARITGLDYSFQNMDALRSVSIPTTAKNSSISAFQYCKMLNAVIIPTGTQGGLNNWLNQSYICIVVFCSQKTNISTMMRDCPYLQSVVLPPNLVSIIGYQFYNDTSLTSLIIPKKVTDIGAYAMTYCSGMAFIDFSRHTAVPTLANTNAFTGIPEDCKIIVPDALYDTWIAATNWSTYASYIIKKSDWDNLQ